MGWRVVVDEVLCQGHEVCASEAPEVFDIDPDHKVRVLAPSPDDTLRQAVELAVRYCPTHALSIVED